jgi:hypothetical protein
MANWGESFGESFNQGMKLGFEKWKQQQENDPTVIANKAKATMQGYLQAQQVIGGDNTTADPNAEDFKSKIFKDWGIPEKDLDKYDITPKLTIFKGMPQKTFVPTPKTGQKVKVPARQLELLQDTIDIVNGMDNLSKELGVEGYKIGAGSPRFWKGGIGNISMYLKGSDKESSFKAATDRYFQKYRKITTGVQAGYPELQWLSADVPSTDIDRPDQFISKAKMVRETNLENAKNMLETLKSAGYNVENFEKQLNKLGGVAEVPKELQPMVDSYMKKYPNRSQEEIVKAMQKKGLLK